MLEYIYSEELYHHGVKGMKWGVRKYQTKMNRRAKKAKSRKQLTEERTIPAGTKMYRTSSNPNENLEGSTYVSYLDVDRNHYKSGWIRKIARSDKAYEYEFELKKDLKIPSRKLQYEIINNVVNSNKKYINEVLESYVNQLFPKGSMSYLEMNTDYKGGVKGYTNDLIDKWKHRTPQSCAYTTCQSLGLAPNVKKEIISQLQNKGYNAMVDEASVGGQLGWGREGYDPLVIFDSSSLSKVNKKEISSTDETKAFYKDKEWQRNARSKNAQWSNNEGIIL